jgi:hypothetical protein
MKSLLLGFLIFNFSILILQCGLDIEDPTPPSAPVWVQKSLPEEWPERGIDAYEGGGIFLEWEPVADENILAYLIYRAELFDYNDSMGDYRTVIIIENQPNTDLGYIDTEVQRGVKYFYKLKSEDNSENKSDYSDSIAYSLLHEPNPGELSPNGFQVRLNDERQLRWRYYFWGEAENYCLTILTANNDLVSREILMPQNYLGSPQTWDIPDAIVLISGHIYKWRIDASAKFIGELETEGSESPWATFVYLDG